MFRSVLWGWSTLDRVSRCRTQIVGGIDKDAQSLATSALNHGHGTWECVEIEQFSGRLTAGDNHPIWKANTILAGLPCQGFSRAGKRDPNDPRNTLYQELLRIVRKVVPQYVVFENVVGLTTRDNRRILARLQRRLESLGYSVAVRILNAAEYGVPQLRKRVFVVAVRDGLARWVFECLGREGKTGTVRTAFRGLPRNTEVETLSHVFMKHTPTVTAKLLTLMPGGPISYRRLVWNKPAPTLVAGHRALPVHPDEPRAISVREAARLQGFDDSYLFAGSHCSQIEQVANAVPPPLAEAIGRALNHYREYGKRVRGRLYQALIKQTTPMIGRTFTRTFCKVSAAEARYFPWRSVSDPYRVLVTELLLQRTNAALANQVWKDVIALVPTPATAARVHLGSLSALTKRIGIGSRARTIKVLGRELMRRFRGQVPREFEELMHLPGVGLYIASAVRAFCFGEPDFPIDSNAFRFVSRYFGLDLAGKKSEGRQLREFLSSLVPADRPKEFIYGFLDFAATICRPKNPVCSCCPLRNGCRKYRA